MKKLILSTLLVFGALISNAQALHYKIFAINRAAFSQEFQKYMFDENLPANGDIFVTNFNGIDRIHVYTGQNDHITFDIIRQIYDNYNGYDHQIGYSCRTKDGSMMTVKFMFKETYVEVYFFFDTTAIVYSVTPKGRF